MPAKRHLVTPGPTPVPPEVVTAMSQPMLHHRGPDFQAIADRVRTQLREVFRTAGDILLFSSSGTGAMEAAVVNLCSPGDRVLVASAGHFGERWVAIARSYGLDVVHLRYAWGETPAPAEIASQLSEAGGARAVYITHSETSTGVVADLRAIAERLSGSGALLAVDAVSSLGAVPVEADAWGLDVVVSGSQKALMTPPGLALSSLSPAARSASTTAALPRFSLDWGRVGSFGSTPAVSLVMGIDAALELLLAEGLEVAFDRHRRLGRACRAGAKAMGLELFSPDEDRSAVVTAIRMPADIDGREIVRVMRETSGVTVGGGQGELAGQIVRIGHIGHIGVADVTAALAALEVALAEAGADVERGVAVPAALEAYGGRSPA
jgi:aspartate aminotransferase-like enzyme